MKRLVLIFGFLMGMVTLYGQDTIRKCGVTNEETFNTTEFEFKAELSPEEMVIIDIFKKKDLVIPVVIHIVYNDSIEIPSVIDIRAQIDGLNEDFKGDAWDRYKIPTEFKKLATNMKIQFKLATVDPLGFKTDGITYTKTSRTAFYMDNRVKFDEGDGKTSWNTDNYLNIWVCDLGSFLAGYAQFPNGAKLTDGVVLDYTHFGVTKLVGNGRIIPYRVLTHEVGHWLGLRHIWGDALCGDDKVNDTPKQMGPHWICYNTTHTCGSKNMTCNHMDYVPPQCSLMFTKGQKKRVWKYLAKHRRSMTKPINQKYVKPWGPN